MLCASQSVRCLAAYLYSAAGFGESTTDLAWDGHLAVFEMGAKLAESERERIDARCAELGARCLMVPIKPGKFADGHTIQYNHARMDPLWAAIEKLSAELAAAEKADDKPRVEALRDELAPWAGITPEMAPSVAADLVEAMATLENAIRQIDRESRQLLQQTFDSVNANFAPGGAQTSRKSVATS